MDYSREQLEGALRKLYDAGRMDEARVVAQKLQESSTPAQAAPATPKPQQDWFFGSSYAYPPSPETVEKTKSGLRGGLADFVFGPSQMAAGWFDIANQGAKKMNFPLTTDARLSQKVSAARNFAAGREGTGAGPATGLLQGLSTAPMGGGFWSSVAQGAGLGAGLTTPEESVFEEGAKGGAVAGGMSTIAKVLGGAPKKSPAEQRITDIAKRENVPIRYGTETNTPQIKEMEARAERNFFLGFGRNNIAFKEREAGDQAMAKAVWKKIGMEFDEFTPDNFSAAAKTIGKDFEQPFKRGPIPLIKDGQPLPEFRFALNEARRVIPEMADPAHLNSALKLVEKKIGQGSMNASERNFMFEELRGLRGKAIDENNANVAKAIDSLIEAFDIAAIRQIPGQIGKERYLAAAQKWANLKVVEDVYKKSGESARGNLDFSKLKSSIERSMPGGYVYGRASLADLAALGEAMKGKAALPEGIKATLVDPAVYLGFNNPISSALRDRSLPIPVLSAGLKAAGIQSGTE